MLSASALAPASFAVDAGARPLPATPPADVPAPRSTYEDEYLHASRQAAEWIRSAAVRKPRGLVWLPEPDHPEKATTYGADNSFYAGSAGTALFFLELAEATGDGRYLEDARQGAQYLAATWEDAHPTAPNDPFSLPLTFDWGMAGTAFSLTEVWKKTQDAACLEAARGLTRRITAAARPAGRGLEWSGAPGVAFDGGLVLYLLYAARAFDDPALLQIARRGGQRLLERGQPAPRGGLRWQGDGALVRPGAPKDAWYPNFESGAAGVGYVLGRLYEDTGQAEFLDGARAAATHIRSIAAVHDDAALVYYREPDLTELYYLGYCHGPPGTARLFYQLSKIDNNPDHMAWVEKLARGVIRSGVPEKQTPGYWNVACQCCGSAAVVEFFLSLWVVTHKAEYRDFANRVADQLISRASDLDGKGDRWYQAWTRMTPWDVHAETGYKMGASGIGATLLHAHLAKRDRYRAVLLPDNPFPRAQTA